MAFLFQVLDSKWKLCFSECLTKTGKRRVEPNRQKMFLFMIFCSFKSGQNWSYGSIVQSAVRICLKRLSDLWVTENKNNLLLSTVYRISLFVRKSVTILKHVVFCHFKNSCMRSRRNPDIDNTLLPLILPTFKTAKHHETYCLSMIWLNHLSPSFCQAFRKQLLFETRKLRAVKP
jgi:hypothetical protein